MIVCPGMAASCRILGLDDKAYSAGESKIGLERGMMGLR